MMSVIYVLSGVCYLADLNSDEIVGKSRARIGWYCP